MLVLGPPTLPVASEETVLSNEHSWKKDLITIHLIIWLKFIWYISLFLLSKFYGAEIKFTPRKQQSSIPSKHKYGRKLEILRTIPQHYFFCFGVIRNAQNLRAVKHTQYLNSLFQVGRLYRDVSYPFSSFDWKPPTYQSFDWKPPTTTVGILTGIW